MTEASPLNGKEMVNSIENGASCKEPEDVQGVDNSRWKIISWILAAILFVVTVFAAVEAVAAVVVFILELLHVQPNHMKWYNNGTVYEILSESYQDSSEFNNGTAQLGEGVGDINGKY